MNDPLPPQSPGGPYLAEALTRARVRRRRLSTPVVWLLVAAVVVLAFAICHALGMRESVSAVCGTTQANSAGGALAGAAYILLYLATVVVCPILVLAAGIYAGLSRVLARPVRGAQSFNPKPR